MTALSVSISTRMSPAETLSPTFFTQELMTPSSMVSERRGMWISLIGTPYPTRLPTALRVSLMAVLIDSTDGSAADSSGFAYGMGTSARATRRTGAYRDRKSAASGQGG